MRLWKELEQICKPTILLDVGANYGEFGMGTGYPTARDIFLVEGNRSLHEFLQKTKSRHPQAGKIHLIHALASDGLNSGTEGELFVNSRWSGTSTAAGPTDSEAWESQRVPMTSVDEILGEVDASDSLLFKIDVEGFEGKVLQGMRKALEMKRCMGLIEFNHQNLKQAGTDPGEVFKGLQAKGDIYLITEQGDSLRSSIRRVNEVFDIPDGKEDILFISRELTQELGDLGNDSKA
ncbi:FkbM family methyltransferase [Haloferula luteola]|uniref:FkbM family methyltransferase n=1 Tax=Haloferula luteola TaxID=595692 RepID=UPI0016201ECD|nr:FkbM family methyltransferase [Haloferula luteola]